MFVPVNDMTIQNYPNNDCASIVVKVKHFWGICLFYHFCGKSQEILNHLQGRTTG